MRALETVTRRLVDNPESRLPRERGEELDMQLVWVQWVAA
jgi:hypothetical protein